MADPLSSVSPVTPTPSLRRLTSTSDTIECLTSAPPEPIKTKSSVLKSKELPPDYEYETPPPSYPASLRGAEGRAAAAGPGAPVTRNDGFVGLQRGASSAPVYLDHFVVVPIVGVIRDIGIIMGVGRAVKPDNIPPTFSATSTGLPSSTTSASGEKNRLVYTDVGGQRPIVGSSITVVSEVGDPDTMKFIKERVFFHDTDGQLYESSAYRGDLPADSAQNRIWRLDMIPGAIMAVNASIAATKINFLDHIRGPYPGPRRYNDLSAAAIFFHANNGTIMRIRSPSPGFYDNIKPTPYTNSGLDGWDPLAVTQLNTTDGYKFVLAYYDNTSPGNFQDVKVIKFVDGWWDRSSPYGSLVSKRLLYSPSDLSDSTPELYEYPSAVLS